MSCTNAEPPTGTDTGTSEEIMEIAITAPSHTQDQITQEQQIQQESLMGEMEVQCMQFRSERDAMRDITSRQTSQISELQSSITELQSKLTASNTDLTAAQREKESETNNHDIIRDELKHSNERIESSLIESDSLREEIARISASNSELNAKLSEIETTSKLSNSSVVPLQYENKRLKTEYDGVTNHSSWLESELAAKTDQLSSLRQSHGDMIAELKSELDTARDGRDDLNAKVVYLQKWKDQNDLEKNRLEEEVHTKKIAIAEMMESSAKEIESYRKVSDLWREKCESIGDKFDELARDRESEKIVLSETIAELEVKKIEMIHVRTEIESASGGHGKIVEELQSSLEQETEKREKAEKDLDETSLSFARLRRRLTSTSDPSTAMVEIPTEESAHPHTLALVDPDTDIPMSLTRVYSRLNSAEDELHAEKAERRSLELYLRKIQQEIESKAPMFRQQKRDYEMAVSSQQQLKQRLHIYRQQEEEGKEDIENLSVELRDAKQNIAEFRQENVDLAMQVQSLLKSQLNLEETEDDGDIVTFGSVEELQGQNQRLLGEFHQLTNTVSDLKEKLQEDKMQADIEGLQEEVQHLRDEREKQTALNAGILQQRDLYRALVSSKDCAEGDALIPTGILQQEAIASRTELIMQEKIQIMEDLAKVKAEYLSVKNANAPLEEKLARMETHTSSLTASIDELHAEILTVKSSLGRSNADASYHKDKCAALEESIQNCRKELAAEGNFKKDVMRTNTDLQKMVTNLQNKSDSYSSANDQIQVKLRLLQTQFQTAQAAEARYAKEAETLRIELARNGAMLDSVQRIESVLGAKAKEDEQSLKEKIANLSETIGKDEIKFTTQLENMERRCDDAKVKLAEAERKEQDAVSSSLESKDRALMAQSQLQSLGEKCQSLESALESANSKLDIPSQEQIDALTLNLKSTASDLETANSRVNEYQLSAKQSNDSLAELTKVTDLYKNSSSSENATMKKELERVTKDLESKQVVLRDITSELGTLQNERNKTVKDISAELDRIKSDKSDLNTRVEALKCDLQASREEASNANRNYDRELALHAAARSDLRTARDEGDVERRLRTDIESRLNQKLSELEGERSVWEIERVKLEERTKELEVRLEEARGQNSLLCNQMRDLTKTVEKIQKERVKSVSEMDASASQESDAGEEDEITKLQKKISELREIVSYMGSERDMLDAQLNALKQSSDRERGSGIITKRNLDEAHAELKLLQEVVEKTKGSSSLISGADKENQTHDQLMLLRESNTLLRAESEQVSSKLASMDAKYNELTGTHEKVQGTARSLLVDKQGLESEKESLTREVDSWKGRVQNLISKFQQIDPEEHAKVLSRVDIAEKKNESLVALKDRAEEESSRAISLVSRLNKDASEQKSLHEASNQKLVDASAKIEELKTQHVTEKAVIKERDELKVTAKKATDELVASKAELQANKKRVQHLQSMLKRLKDIKEGAEKKLATTIEANSSLLREKQSNEAALKEQQANFAKMKKNKISLSGTAPVAKPPASVDDETPGLASLSNTSEPTGPSDMDAKSLPTNDSVAASVTKPLGIPPGGFKFVASVTKPLVIPPGGFKFVASPSQRDQITAAGTAAVPLTPKVASTITTSSAIVPNGAPTGTTAGGTTPKIASTTTTSGTTSPRKPKTATSTSVVVLNDSTTQPDPKDNTVEIPESSKSEVGKEPEIPEVKVKNTLRSILLSRKRKLAEEMKKKSDETAQPDPKDNTAEVPESSKSEVGKKPEISEAVAKNALRSKLLSRKRKLAEELKKKSDENNVLSLSQRPTKKTAPLATPVENEDPTLTGPEPVPENATGAKEADSSKSTLLPTSTEDKKPTESVFAPKTVVAEKASTATSTFGSVNKPPVPLMFGSAATATKGAKPSGFFGAFGTPGIAASSSGAGAFLKLNPPMASSSKPLTFGSSSNIILPVPHKTPQDGSATAQGITFGSLVFGQGSFTSAVNPSSPFGTTKALFGDVGKTATPAAIEVKPGLEQVDILVDPKVVEGVVIQMEEDEEVKK